MEIRANPFVVLADITIALCFIFAVYAVSSTAMNSQLVLFFDRDSRQQDAETAIAGAFRERFGDLPETHHPERGMRAFGDAAKPAAVVWVNGSYQRVSIYRPLFAKGTASLTDEGRHLFLDLGKLIAPRAHDLSYVYLHGIVEPEEVPARHGRTVGSEWARRLSQDRAQAVFDLMQQNGSIAGYGTSETRALAAGKIPAMYAIPYGTADALYSCWWQSVGRVDVVLFYSDRSLGRDPAPAGGAHGPA
jgi:hypothetical protein